MSAISAIRNRFSIGQQHSSGFANQRGAANKTLLSIGGDSSDEVSYAGFNDKDSDFDIQMLQDSLEYEAYKDMSDSDRKNR